MNIADDSYDLVLYFKYLFKNKNIYFRILEIKLKFFVLFE